MTEEEYADFTERLKHYDMSQAEFIRQAITRATTVSYTHLDVYKRQVMSNHHLRNKERSLKAKGLLAQMLSLPEDWDYTLKGLSLINREKIDAIREAIKELERAG